jgi:hypothetical protein
MNLPSQPNVKLQNGPDYRENYANSVQMRVNIWDFFLVFGTLQQQTETQVEIKNFQGIYLSPQQAKALLGLLQQNVAGYESAFGEIKLDPRMGPSGPVHYSGSIRRDVACYVSLAIFSSFEEFQHMQTCLCRQETLQATSLRASFPAIYRRWRL